MNTGILSQAVGLLACGGALVILVVAALIALGSGIQRGRRASANNPVIQPPSAAPFEDDDFGGVPTTGAVQEYEREYRPDPLIGSSGFDAQSYETGREQDEED